MPHFRTLDGGSPRGPSPNLLATVQMMQKRQSWMREYLVENGEKPLPFVGAARRDEQPVSVVQSIRQALDIDESWASRKPTWTEALRTLREILENAGILVVTNSIVGTRGFGNHKHNDQLGFEYHVSGMPVVVDPGSYVYTSDPAARNLFRGTGYHNTLMIDGVEQNEFNPEWLFRMFETAQAEHVGFTEDDSGAEYVGRHAGYGRLPQPVMHERSFHLNRTTGRLDITDRLSGSGRHRLSWHFHLAPGVTPRIDDGGCRLASAGTVVELSFPPALTATVADAWYSPSYGVRVPCKALDLIAEVEVGSASEWRFTLAPKESA